MNGLSLIESCAEAASLGRSHGKNQKDTDKDCMMFRFQFGTEQQYDAYLTGFYRGVGYEGSGNRRYRKFAKAFYG